MEILIVVAVIILIIAVCASIGFCVFKMNQSTFYSAELCLDWNRLPICGTMPEVGANLWCYTKRTSNTADEEIYLPYLLGVISEVRRTQLLVHSTGLSSVRDDVACWVMVDNNGNQNIIANLGQGLRLALNAPMRDFYAKTEIPKVNAKLKGINKMKKGTRWSA